MTPFITLPGVSGALYVLPYRIDAVQTKTPTDCAVVCGGQLFHIKQSAEQVAQAVTDYIAADVQEPELDTRYMIDSDAHPDA